MSQGNVVFTNKRSVSLCSVQEIIETLRFLCLNERNISLVAICAVIQSCKDCAKKRHLAPALMHFGSRSRSKMVVSWRYANLSTELSRKFCVATA